MRFLSVNSMRRVHALIPRTVQVLGTLRLYFYHLIYISNSAWKKYLMIQGSCCESIQATCTWEDWCTTAELHLSFKKENYNLTQKLPNKNKKWFTQITFLQSRNYYNFQQKPCFLAYSSARHCLIFVRKVINIITFPDTDNVITTETNLARWQCWRVDAAGKGLPFCPDQFHNWHPFGTTRQTKTDLFRYQPENKQELL